MANNKLYGYTPTTSKEKEGNRLDQYNPYEFRKGMDYELTSMGCMRLAESTIEEREKATESVLKNLESHPAYYSGLIQFEAGMNHAGKIDGKNFKTWLKDHFEVNKMQEIQNGFDRKNVTSDVRAKSLKTPKFDDQMTEPKGYNKKDYTTPFETKPSPLKEEQLRKTIRNEALKILKEQDEEEFDADVDKADKAATKAAKKSKSSNRFDLEREAIKDLLYRGKKGKESEYTEEEPAPKSILDIKNQMLDLYKNKFKGKEGGVDDYNAELKKVNEKFKKILEKHVKTFGEEGKGNNVTLNIVYGEKLPDTIKLLGARLKALEKEEEEDIVSANELRREVAKTDMTREQHIKLLEIIKKHGVSLREGAMGVKQYYNIAKEAYLEGVANGLKI
tara:strand:- start:12 stop:1181 length:1170 start_codon:yes stop_codon:yes gene_type:complete